MWEVYKRRSSGRTRGSISVPSVTIFSGGIRFNRLAKEKWLGEAKYVTVWIDKESHRIAFRPESTPTVSSYRVCVQGKNLSTFYVPCRSAVTAWRKMEKYTSLSMSCREIENGLLEFVPLPEES